MTAIQLVALAGFALLLLTLAACALCALLDINP